jgi:UDP-2,3-diacylglucosamine pyrophosphatase LpxH
MSQSTYPEFSELYVISDLHLGGEEPNGQIFRQGKRLENFIRRLESDAKGLDGKLALVLAGDVIDTLPPYQNIPCSYIHIDNAVEIVNRIMKNPSFRCVFCALSSFLDNDKCELVILSGNHDLELALPEVQETILHKIAGNDSAKRGKVRFITQGIGFRCKVGTKTIYVTHGNETDEWNHVDHEQLREFTHAQALGHVFNSTAWIPNYGTKLVVDIMNKFKKEHPFIDLLKPETSAAMGILVALQPDAYQHCLSVLWLKAKSKMQTNTVLRQELSAFQDESGSLRGFNETSFKENYSQVYFSDIDLVAEVERMQKKGIKPDEWVSDGDLSLSIWDGVNNGYSRGKECFFDLIDDVKKFGNDVKRWEKSFEYILHLRGSDDESEALRESLKLWLRNDSSFDLENKDDTFQRILNQITEGEGIDIAIAGHTHLPRWIEPRINEQQPVYLNTGTWARIMGLRKEWLNDKTAFREIFDNLKPKSVDSLDKMDALDKAQITTANGKTNLILDITVAAHVSVSSDKPKLVHINKEGNEEDIPLKNNILEWPQ